MKVVEIKDLKRKDLPLYYRREFFGSAILELMSKKTEKRLSFVIENKPAGGVDIRITLLDEIEYPLVPVVSTLKNYILDLDKRGILP